MWPHQRAFSKLFVGLAVVLTLALVPVPPAAPQTNAVRLTQVSVKTFGESVQLAMIATGPLTYRTLQLTSPPRVVIDLPGVTVDEAVPSLIEVGRGGLARVRVGQFQTRPAIARIAVDLDVAMPLTVSTTSPSVLVARFAARPAPQNVAAAASAPPTPAPAPAAAPAAPPAPVAQAPTPPPAPVPAPQPAQPVGPTRINLEFRATEIADVLTALARVCNVNIVTDAAVRGQITVRLVDLTCDEALRFILEANNLGFRRLGRNLIILPQERLAPPPEAPEAISYPIGFGDAGRVAEAIRAAVPGIRVTADVRSNTIVVVGTQAQHEQVQRILGGLDIMLPTVVVETRVVDLSVSDLTQWGLNWGLTSVPIINVVGTFPGQVQVGVGDFTIRAALDALVTQRRARVITAPRVAVIDGNEAQVNLGEEVPIPSIDAAGRLTFTFKPIGVILRILPKVNRDGFITTRVEPEVSSVIEFLPTSSGPVPRIATRRASTTMTVRSGQSIVLAGLISAQERRTVLKVPLLGDIPVLGALFRITTTDRAETEVIFVVTPQLVTPPGSSGAPAPAGGTPPTPQP